ncbi:hypothetical protein [Aliiroseovarius sp. F20344]|uniref:hypothetical protein n=1 Tax=Aliiroseovarius sp. F20344 TaxID=2926414 RepID=UPI001FF5756A|nr:hypothetical protein [Aliiroseovarius sp. F20344]MCK0142758.1 hypothetical protein [Aliiroseovarius sp. F20344]
MRMFIKTVKTVVAASTIGLGLIAAPHAAQAMPMPTLSYPDAGNGWGCRFTNTCENGSTQTRENR